MFVAGMVLFEKSERTLDALIVTPLPPRTYLASKVFSLSGFATVESLILVLLTGGPKEVAFLPLVLGVIFLGIMYTLISIAQVVSQTSVTDFLVPGGIISMTLLQIPLLHAFGVWSHPLLYVFPTQATVILLVGAFQPLAPWQWVYGTGYSLLSIAVLAWLARWRFQGQIVEQGTRMPSRTWGLRRAYRSRTSQGSDGAKG